MKLYVYDHCPYCVKARMIFGLKNQEVDVVYLNNDDEKTPIDLVGQKILPILIKNDGMAMPESMDIVRYIDQLDGDLSILGSNNSAISDWLEEAGPALRSLQMAHYTKIPFEEFKTQSAIDYFTQKKEAALGESFESLIDKKESFLSVVNPLLLKLNDLIQSPDAVNGVLSEDDFHLFPTLRNSTFIKGIEFPEKVLSYLEKMSALSTVPLLFQYSI